MERWSEIRKGWGDDVRKKEGKEVEWKGRRRKGKCGDGGR
jgi:hypothetical protein